MRQYIIKTTCTSRADVAAALADGKHAFSVVFVPGVVRHYTADGRPAGAEESMPDRDAVPVTSLEEKAVKAARTRAAGRETVRAVEDAAADILEKAPASFTDDDIRALLSYINVAYHDSGKIEGNYSIDGTAGCEFCQKMRAAADANILIICGQCYAAADSYKEFSWRRHSLNARILSSVLFTVEQLKTLYDFPAGSRVRINEDGDTVNETHARNILRLFEAFPHVCFGYWYKNSAAVAAGLAAEGVTCRAEKLARYGNARFIHSSLLIGFRAAVLWFDDATFTVYPDQTTTDAAIAAGAWSCNGRRCRACGFWCYTPEHNGGTVPDIAELLRCSKAARAAVMSAYTAQLAAAKLRPWLAAK